MNRLLCLLLVLTLGFQTAQAQRYSKRQIKKDLQELPGFENAFIGFLLVDPSKEKPIYEQYADKYMTPGSTTKLFTIYGAMNYLPEVLPALEYVTKGDSLILEFWFHSLFFPLNSPKNKVLHLKPYLSTASITSVEFSYLSSIYLFLK